MSYYKEWSCLLIQDKGSFIHNACGACHTWSPVKALRYKHNVSVNIIVNNSDDQDVVESINVLLWDARRRWKTNLGKKGLHLQQKKNGFVQCLFYVIMSSSTDSLFFSKTPYYSHCYSVA